MRQNQTAHSEIVLRGGAQRCGPSHTQGTCVCVCVCMCVCVCVCKYEGGRKGGGKRSRSVVMQLKYVVCMW